jgi:hypothetical protein
MQKAWNSTLNVGKGFKSRGKPLKRSPFKRKAVKSRKRPLKAPVARVKLESWLRAIPESQSHGSGTLQKRLWRVKSDFVRIRDWHTFDGRCVATGKKIAHWSEGQAGHLKPYSKCNGMFKFNEMNIHMQSYASNKWPTRDDWKNYEAELERRYSDQFVPAIERSNRDWPLKFTNEQVVDEIKRTLKMLGMCKEQPDYYPRVMSLLAQKETMVE